MLKFDDINDLKRKLSIFENIFTGVRLVNPVTKEVICTIHIKQGLLPFLCYQFWNGEKSCENCISAQAINEKRVIMKIGGNNSGVFTVTSIPVQFQEKNLALELLQDVTGNLYFETDMERACEKPETIMHSVFNHINRLIVTDDLTGLYNRRFVEESLPTVIASANKTGRSVSIIFVDVDHFKGINDIYGHDAGDHILRSVAALLRENIRESDGWAARYGGDEFMICLPGANNKIAQKIAERLRINIMAKAFQIAGETIHLTCSFGVQTISCIDDTITACDFINLADKNLYLAKRNGRNQVV